jgi:hypothetical protein
MNYRLHKDDLDTVTTTTSPLLPSERTSSVLITSNNNNNNDFSEDVENETNEPISIKKSNFIKEIVDLVAQRKYQELLVYDELTALTAVKRNILSGFAVLPNFYAPTYKRLSAYETNYSPSLQNYLNNLPADNQIQNYEFTNSDDASNSYNYIPLFNDKKIPSYTDRILYKSIFPSYLNLIDNKIYCCESTISSDHKPVYAKFILQTSDGENGILVDEDVFSSKQDTTYTTAILSNLTCSIDMNHSKFQ